MRGNLKLASAVAILLAGLSLAQGEIPFESRLALAASLGASGEHSLSALEYRTLAADLAPGDPSIPSLYLSAAEAYSRERRWDRMGRMLDAAEDAAAQEDALLYLRLRRAEGLRDWTSAADYAEDLAAARSGDEALSNWAQREAAVARLRETGLPAGDKKSPRVGGLLGIVPGLGYAYSGEWGNALRCLFLNGLFGWAMFECADHDRWGLFAVTTFFELTWYTGSIYGGIDAAHRHNRRRLDEAAGNIRGNGPSPHLERDGRLDVLSLRLAF